MKKKTQVVEHVANTGAATRKEVAHLAIRPKRRPVLQIARAIRSHLKQGLCRREILEAENLTVMQYRHAMKVLGAFPNKNAEAFAQAVVGTQNRLSELADDMERVRTAGEFKSLAAFHRVRNEIVNDLNELALKLGILQKTAEKLEVSDVSYRASFGDEVSLTKWPALGDALNLTDSEDDNLRRDE